MSIRNKIKHNKSYILRYGEFKASTMMGSHISGLFGVKTVLIYG